MSVIRDLLLNQEAPTATLGHVIQKKVALVSILYYIRWANRGFQTKIDILLCEAIANRGYSSVVEHLTADQEVPSSTLGAPLKPVC